MSRSQRIVIDTSTLVGAMLHPDSVPRRAFLAAVRIGELCVTEATLQEVLQRPKFDRFIPLQDRLAFLTLVSGHVSMWEIHVSSDQAATGVCRDDKDTKFLSLALSCRADVLISSDGDLLVLHPWQGIPILTPAAFLEKLID
ncbi:MAG: putative toxin-antitoxin system toxin component, PIN family [Acidithiobacillus sp.]